MIVKEQIKEPCVCIVHFIQDQIRAEAHGLRNIYYQVTIDPRNTSEGGFIRFGNIRGDEITGWIPERDLVIDEVLIENCEPKYIKDRTPYQNAA